MLMIPADDYLDVRDPSWGTLERAGAIRAHAGRVYFPPDLHEILVALDRMRPRPEITATPVKPRRGPKIGRAVRLEGER